LVDKKIVQPEASESGRWRLRASCYVGRAVFGSVSLVVVEKFAGAFKTLVSLGALRSPLLTDTSSPISPSPGSTALLVSLFVRAARTYLSGSKQVAYIAKPGTGAIVAGKLDILRTSRLRAKGIFHQAAFRREVLTSDLPLNRCIYAALREVERLARTADIDAHDVASARALRLGLSECLPSILKLNHDDLATLAAREAAGRHTRPERADVASLAGAILDAAGFGGPEDWKRTIDRSWFVSLEAFFEEAMRRVVSSTLNDTAKVTGPQNRPSLFKPNTGRYRANPDIVICRDGRIAAIADAKYKDFVDWPSASDVHEIVAHAAAYGAPTALLFYPDERGFSVRSFGDAVTGCRLWGFGIDLGDIIGSVRRALITADLLNATS
jgi:hypothetical protein